MGEGCEGRYLDIPLASAEDGEGSRRLLSSHGSELLEDLLLGGGELREISIHAGAGAGARHGARGRGGG